MGWAGTVGRSLLMLLMTSGAVAAQDEVDGAVLRISEQWTNGESLKVIQVTVPEAAWVVVHAVARKGDEIESRIIGRIAVAKGTRSDIEVPLTEPVNAGQVLLVLLHEDKGVPGKFEFDADNDFIDDLILVKGAPVGAIVQASAPTPPEGSDSAEGKGGGQ